MSVRQEQQAAFGAAEAVEPGIPAERMLDDRVAAEHQFGPFLVPPRPAEEGEESESPQVHRFVTLWARSMFLGEYAPAQPEFRHEQSMPTRPDMAYAETMDAAPRVRGAAEAIVTS